MAEITAKKRPSENDRIARVLEELRRAISETAIAAVNSGSDAGAVAREIVAAMQVKQPVRAA